MATALVPRAVQHSSDFSGDTLMVSDAHEYLDTIRMQEADAYFYGSDERYDHAMDNNMFYESDGSQNQCMVNTMFWPTSDIKPYSRGILGDPSNIQRAEDSLYLPLHTPWVGNYMARGELNTPKRAHRLFPLVRPGVSPPLSQESHSHALAPAPYPNSEASSDKSRSTSGGTVEIHPLPSPTSSNTSRSECKCIFHIEWFTCYYDQKLQLWYRSISWNLIYRTVRRLTFIKF